MKKLFNRTRYVNCSDCGRGAKLVWRNIRDYRIQPVDRGDGTVSVYHYGQLVSGNPYNPVDKWLTVWVGLKPHFICGSCQAKRRQWALNHFQTPRTKSAPNKPPKQERDNPFPFLDSL